METGDAPFERGLGKLREVLKSIRATPLSEAGGNSKNS